ncbi:GNAT family N-acetyltransferase [Kordiimonas aestuarii]|uniref:GNAT family N-acetyltransferase n=1 Tax=Kordiimonas aestuarii TaxID=1005925 RepID=UPI0021D0336F|nr:GNAT family N-acetyltransferase [Kordiimonas aestuarii]
MTVSIEQMTDIDLPGILALNNLHQKETSFLEPEDLNWLVANAYYARGVAPAKAFLIGFDQDGAYKSPNFVWFKERYERFAYIDRIITAAEARGQGLARALYEDLFATAKANGYNVVGCEVNQNPPNPGSDAFHAKLGFETVGTATLANGKTVRYLTKTL